MTYCRMTKAITLCICAGACLTAGLSLVVIGCSPYAAQNITSPLSETSLVNVAGTHQSNGQLRGDIGVGFINRTPYRAIGTFGGYDPLDSDTIVTMGQLGVTQNIDLGPNSVGWVWALACTRMVSVGGKDIIEKIYENEIQMQTMGFRLYGSAKSDKLEIVPSLDLLKENIGFTGAPFGDAQGNIPTQGYTKPMGRYLGRDYTLGSVLVFSFVQDDAAEGGFRIDYTSSNELGVDPNRLAQLTPPDRGIALANVNMDRMTFQLFSTFGLLTTTSSGLPKAAGGAADKATVSISNTGTGSVGIAFFGPEKQVIKVVSGGSNSLTFTPGYYEFLVLPPTSASRPIQGSQVLEANFIYTLGVSPS